MKKIKFKILNDGTQPKLWTRVLIIQLASVCAYLILPKSEFSLAILLSGVFIWFIAYFFLED
jgi:hypothetical protein